MAEPIEIVGGHFRARRARLVGDGLVCGWRAGFIHYNDVESACIIAKGKMVDDNHRASSAVTGAFIGGAIATVFSAGIGAPAGAALGAAAGGVLILRKKAVTFRLNLYDGRHLVASAPVVVWETIRHGVDYAKRHPRVMPPLLTLDMIAEKPSVAKLLTKKISGYIPSRKKTD